MPPLPRGLRAHDVPLELRQAGGAAVAAQTHPCPPAGIRGEGQFCQKTASRCYSGLSTSGQAPGASEVEPDARRSVSRSALRGWAPPKLRLVAQGAGWAARQPVTPSLFSRGRSLSSSCRRVRMCCPKGERSASQRSSSRCLSPPVWLWSSPHCFQFVV